MAETQKAEWQKLIDELRAVADGLKDAQHRHNALSDRLTKVEDFQEKVQPNMWFVTGAKAILGLIAGIVLSSIGYAIYWMGATSSDLKHSAEAIARLEKSVEENARMSNRILEQALKRLVTPATFLMREGTVSRVGDKEIEVQIGPQKDDLVTYKVETDSRITVHGKDGKLADLKAGEKVRVGVATESKGKGRAAWIETADTPPPSGFQRYEDIRSPTEPEKQDKKEK